MLKFQNSLLQSEEQRSADNSSRFMGVMEKWIELGRAGSYPATWSGLQQVLIDVEMNSLAFKIKSALDFCE